MASYGTYTEHELITLLKDGNREAFAEIYRRNWQHLYNSAYKRLKDEVQCEDLVQNIFMDLWERRNTTNIENLSAYLYTAVRFQAIKYSTRLPGTSPLVDKLESTLVSPFGSEDPLIENETLELVRLWIAALPEKRREMFLMYYSQELSSSRIAELLGVSQKTVQNQIATATNTIREQLSRLLFASLLTILIVLGYLDSPQ
jgi:RNA polymerase sigma factor (sigma-70 family)